MYNLLLLTLFSLPLVASEPAKFTSLCWDAHGMFNNDSVHAPWFVVLKAQKSYLSRLLAKHETGLLRSLISVTKGEVEAAIHEHGNYTELDAAITAAVKEQATAGALPQLLSSSNATTDSLGSLITLEATVRAHPEQFPYVHPVALLTCHANIAAHFGAMEHAQQQLEQYFPNHDFTRQPLGDRSTALTTISQLPSDSLREVRKLYATFLFARDSGKAALYKIAKDKFAFDFKKNAPNFQPFTIDGLSRLIQDYLLELDFTDNDLRWIKAPGENDCWDPTL